MQVLTSLTRTQLTPNCDALAFMQSTKKSHPALKKKKNQKQKLYELNMFYVFRH